MSLRSILILGIALGAALSATAPLAAQESPAKRLANVIGVAVDEYGKGVDESGKIFLQMEYDEAAAFLTDARDLVNRITDGRKDSLATLIDEMRVAVDAKVAPSVLNAIHARAIAVLGSDAALDYPTDSVDVAEGARLYAQYCASCHGATGDGDGPAAAGMNPVPPAFADAELMADVSPAIMFRISSVGIQGTQMGGFSSELTAAQRWAVVTYVTTLRAKPGEAERGAALLAERVKRDSVPPEGHTFGWLAERHDQQVLAALAASDAAFGLDVRTPLTSAQQREVLAALRAHPTVVVPPVRTPEVVAADVMRVLDQALVKGRAGDFQSARDLAFDAYVTFEPLETGVRTRDPSLVTLMERHFADFKGAMQTGDLAGANAARERLAVGMPAVIDLAASEPSGWGSFIESFLIIVREGLEAILIIAAVMAFLTRTGNASRVREVKWGAWLGVAASAVLAVILRTVLANAPASREVIEGATMLVAVAVLFSVSYWLITKVEVAHWQAFIREKVGAALSSSSTTALAIVAFLAVFREGAETALFYQAILLRGSHVIPPLLGGIAAGSVVLIAVWIVIQRFGRRLPLRGFFATTSVLLYVMAFAFMGKGIRELQEGNAIGITPVPGGPYFAPLGIFPSVETLVAQGVLVALALFAAWRTFVRPSAVAAASPST